MPKVCRNVSHIQTAPPRHPPADSCSRQADRSRKTRNEITLKRKMHSTRIYFWTNIGRTKEFLHLRRRVDVSRCLCGRTYSEWKPAVGLEIHAQIQSKSKLFSGATTEFQTPVNDGVSLFDAAFPGTLPMLNKRCVEAGVLTALALSCEVHPISHFDRKHYFYADLPAGYQITQQRSPLAKNGSISFIVYSEGSQARLYPKTSYIHQLQLEQDSGRSLHTEDRSLVDLNRAGVPLMEIVFKPDLNDGEEAASLVKELCLILTRLGTCSCKMEEGALRVDANVSIHKQGSPLGVRTEIKNISSTRAIASAIDYEIKRQISVIESGHQIINETLFWNAEISKTVPMRDKEEKQDYRYMPEPNLPPLKLRLTHNDTLSCDMMDVLHIQGLIPELPEKTRQRFQEKYNISLKHAFILVNHEVLCLLFNEVLKHKHDRNSLILCNLLLNDVMELLNEDSSLKFLSGHIGEIVDELQDQRISKSIARKILRLLVVDERSPKQIIEEENWGLKSSPSYIEELCRSVLTENEDTVRVHMSGKKNNTKTLERLTWAKSDGLANMNVVKEWFSKNLPFTKSAKSKCDEKKKKEK